MREIVEDRRNVPLQVVTEMHYQTNEVRLFPRRPTFVFVPCWRISFWRLLTAVPQVPQWSMRFRKEAELALFADYLWREASYALLGRADNPNCPHCSRVLWARLQ